MGAIQPPSTPLLQPYKYHGEEGRGEEKRDEAGSDEVGRGEVGGVR